MARGVQGDGSTPPARGWGESPTLGTELVAEGAGKCSIVMETPELTTFESHLIRVRLDRYKTSPPFYYYYFKSYIGFANIQSLVMQVAAAGIRGSDLALLQVPHPPLPTQQKIAAVLSELYFQHPSIDSADFLLELHVEQDRYEELSKVLRNLSERETKLLTTRYEKIKQNLDEKKVVSARDCAQMVVLATLQFFVNEGEKALDAIDTMIDIDIYRQKLLKWVQIVGRERYNDWYAVLLLIKIQTANQDFNAALVQAQRAA